MTTTIYNSQSQPKRRCRIHNPRPIHPATLFKVVQVREKIAQRHAGHHPAAWPEVGCVLCARPTPPGSGATS